jgi:hypothetical protein
MEGGSEIPEKSKASEGMHELVMPAPAPSPRQEAIDLAVPNIEPVKSAASMDSKVLLPTEEPDVYSLGPIDLDDPLRIVDADQLVIPLHVEKQSLDGWSLSFRAWPTLLDGWRDLYARVYAEKVQVWKEAGIAECLPLSFAFWKDTQSS